MNRTMVVPSNVVMPHVNRISMLLQTLNLPIPDTELHLRIFNAFGEIYYQWLVGYRNQEIDTYVDTYLMGDNYPPHRRQEILNYIQIEAVALYNQIYGALNQVMDAIHLCGDELEQIYFCFPLHRKTIVMVLESAPEDTHMHVPTIPRSSGVGGAYEATQWKTPQLH